MTVDRRGSPDADHDGPDRRLIAAERIADYYDRNTRRFLQIGVSGAAGAIHRGLWPPGVRDATAAARVAHARIVELLLARWSADAPLRLADFGCGVGATLCEVLHALPAATGVGVTLSAAQVVAARERARGLDLAARARFEQADFAAFDARPVVGCVAADGASRVEPTSVAERGFDAVWAIEAFAHAADPEAFFANVARQLRRGGVLILIDDFLARPRDAMTPRGRRRVARFARGWGLPVLDTAERGVERAQAQGLHLVGAEDWTPWLRLRRPRDLLVRAGATLARALGGWRHPFWANVIGGDALNAALRHGEVRYRCLVFERG